MSRVKFEIVDRKCYSTSVKDVEQRKLLSFIIKSERLQHLVESNKICHLYVTR